MMLIKAPANPSVKIVALFLSMQFLIKSLPLPFVYIIVAPCA